MEQSKYSFGRIVRAPAQFNPTAIFQDRQYLYKIDLKQKIAKRVPLHWDSPLPTDYVQVELPAPVTPKASKPQPSPRAAKIPNRRWVRFWRRCFTAACLTVAAGALFLLLYPYYPGWRYEIGVRLAGLSGAVPATQVVSSAGGNQLIIPKIGVRTDILEAPTLDILDQKEGVWHQKGELSGNFVLAGHRFKYLPPNTSTFYNLGKLQPGDAVLVDRFNQRYIYTVKQVITVPESQNQVLNDTSTHLLTLYTCSDKAETQRIVVTAEPEK